MSLTPRQARIKLYDHPVIGPSLGLYGTATSVTGSALTDATKLGTTSYGPNAFNGQATIVLPNQSGAEREKVAGAVTTAGVLAPTSAAWTGSYTNEPYEILWGAGKRKLTIAQLVEAARLAMREVYFLYYAPVGFWRTAAGIDNSDFSEGVADWLASGASLSVTQSEDRAHCMFGFDSMLLVNSSGADRYVYHSIGKGVQPNDTYWSAVLARIVTGSGSLSVTWWDATSSLAGVTQIGQTLAGQGAGADLHFGQQLAIPANCYRLNMRITVPDGMTVAIDSLPGHDMAGLWLTPPDWLTANFRLHSINDVTYGRDLSTGVELAGTRNPDAWKSRIDYLTQNGAEDARPGAVQVLKGPGRRITGSLPARDLLWAGLRQESDRCDFADESDVFYGSEDMYMAAYRWYVAQMLEARDQLGPNGKWQALMREERSTLDAQRIVRAEPVSVAMGTRRRTVV